MSFDITALGPLFGPNFIIVNINDDTGKLFQLNIYPDANNPDLKANGLPMHFYFMPQRIYLAKKQDAPDDYDFGMTIFKGLMTTEDTIGITDNNTTNGEVAIGGGMCSFSTTFAIPDNVIQKAVQTLKKKEYQSSSNIGKMLSFFNLEQHDPDPYLGIVPILENNVTIEVPQLQGTDKMPFYLSAQGTGKGSIEARGISTFLVSCNQMTAGAIAGSIEKGLVPFTVHYNLKQQFYINACDITIHVDVDKVYEQFSGAVSAGSFLNLSNIALQANYQSCLTSGAITTDIKMNEGVIPDDLKKMIEKQVEDMQQAAYEMVKKEIFDWTPTPDTPASASRGLLSSIFGGCSVSLKANYQKKGVKLDRNLRLDSSIAVCDTVSGNLADLESAIKANKDKYLAVVNIGEYFKKLQVAATNNANWQEKLPDGTNLADPIKALQIEVGYPDYDNPLDANKKPNPQYRTQGFHYTLGHKDPNAGNELAAWTADNSKDIINVSFMKLDKVIPGWDADQVKLRKTIIFNADDPRVELSNGASTFVKEEITKAHAPIITPSEVGYIFVKFMLDRVLPTDNIILTLLCKIGTRQDTLTITKQNQKNIIWEIFSDKYLTQTAFSYQLQVNVAGPDFTDNPVQYQSDWISAALPTGRIKYINPFKISLPPTPTDMKDTVNSYIKNYKAE